MARPSPISEARSAAQAAQVGDRRLLVMTPLHGQGIAEVRHPPQPRDQCERQADHPHRGGRGDGLVDHAVQGLVQARGQCPADLGLQPGEQVWVRLQHQRDRGERDHQQRHQRKHAEIGDRRSVVVSVRLGVPLAGADQMVKPGMSRAETGERGQTVRLLAHVGLPRSSGALAADPWPQRPRSSLIGPATDAPALLVDADDCVITVGYPGIAGSRRVRHPTPDVPRR